MAQDGSTFARDFGYLMPFLQKMEQAAKESGNAELQQLVAGEAARWRRIQALLGSGAGAPAPAGPSAGARKPAAGGNGALPRQLTIGSLRTR